MRNFQKGGKFKYIIESRTFIIFLGIIVIFFLFNLFNFLGRMQETRKNRELVENKIKELDKSKEQLESEIKELSTDKGAEESIREKFGLAKEGEGMIIVVDDKGNVKVDNQANSSGFFNFFKNWFK